MKSNKEKVQKGQQPSMRGQQPHSKMQTQQNGNKTPPIIGSSAGKK